MHDSKKDVLQRTIRSVLTLPDTVIADGKEQELLEILEKVFCERCGLDLDVSTDCEWSRRRADGEKMLTWSCSRRSMQSSNSMQSCKAEKSRQSRKRRPLKQSGDSKKHLKEKPAVPKEVPQKPKAEETAGKSKCGEKRNTFFQATGLRQKKSDNPDVIYGRDVEGEPIAIEQITGRNGRA